MSSTSGLTFELAQSDDKRLSLIDKILRTV